MNGSKNQIEWANKIVSERIAMVSSINSGKLSKVWWSTNHVSGEVPEFNFDKVVNFLNSMNDASEIIATRNEKTADIYAASIGFKYTEITIYCNENDPFAL